MNLAAFVAGQERDSALDHRLRLGSYCLDIRINLLSVSHCGRCARDAAEARGPQKAAAIPRRINFAVGIHFAGFFSFSASD